MTPKVSIIMGSTSDMPIMQEAAKILNEFQIPFEINALSAHRVPEQVADFAKNAHTNGRFKPHGYGSACLGAIRTLRFSRAAHGKANASIKCYPAPRYCHS